MDQSDTKICSRCGLEKPLSDFYANPRYRGGYTRRCKACVAAAAVETAKSDPERRRAVRKRWNDDNKAKKAAYNHNRRLRLIEERGEEFRDAERKRNREKYHANPQRVAVSFRKSAAKRRLTKPHLNTARNKRRKLKILSHPSLSIAYRLSAIVRVRIKGEGGRKSGRLIDLIGCTVAEFRTHIEKQWLPGMSWTNWGTGHGRWHLDHKRPVSSFDLTDPTQQRACFHYTNYQPLWMIDNVRKGARYEVAA